MMDNASAVEADMIRLRQSLVAALNISDQDFDASGRQNITFKLFIGAYVLDDLHLLPRVGIAQLFGMSQPWVNYAIESVEKRRAHRDYRAHVDSIVEAIRVAESLM